MMECKGYLAQIEYDDSIRMLHGRVVNARPTITFQARSVDELQREMKASVDDYLAWCEERGKEPERPYSGAFSLRVDPELHRSMALTAARERKSLNAWASDTLREAVS